MKKSQYLALTFALGMGAFSAFGQKAGDAAKGKAVFEQCGFCHNSDSTDRKMGPGLKGLFKKAKLDSTGKPATEANITTVINEGTAGGMPPFKDTLSASDKADLIAFLKTL